MAVIGLWAVRTPVKKMLRYIGDPEKTAREEPENPDVRYDPEGERGTRVYVTGVNCAAEYAAEQFLETKRLWSRITGRDLTGGRSCYHGFQAFAPGEVSAETAHEIGVKLAEQMWGGEYEVVVSTHTDKDHFHNHYTVNSVSLLDGHKYRLSFRDYYAMREVSDTLCLKYGLSGIADPLPRSLDYDEYQAERQGMPTHRSLIRADIDRAVRASMTEEEFFRILGQMGYTFRLRDDAGRHLERPALCPPGSRSYYGFDRLGAAGYSMDEVQRRVADNYHRRDPFPAAQAEGARMFREQLKLPAGASGLHALYLRYCRELHILKRYPASVRRVTWFLREDLQRMEKLDRMTRLLGEHSIGTYEELDRFRTGEKEVLEALGRQRHGLRMELQRAYRGGDSEGMARAKEKIAAVTARMKDRRMNIRLCDGIEARSGRMEQALESLMQEHREIQGKEERSHEQHIDGRGGTGRTDQYGRG